MRRVELSLGIKGDGIGGTKGRTGMLLPERAESDRRQQGGNAGEDNGKHSTECHCVVCTVVHGLHMLPHFTCL